MSMWAPFQPPDPSIQFPSHSSSSHIDSLCEGATTAALGMSTTREANQPERERLLGAGNTQIRCRGGPTHHVAPLPLALHLEVPLLVFLANNLAGPLREEDLPVNRELPGARVVKRDPAGRHEAPEGGAVARPFGGALLALAVHTVQHLQHREAQTSGGRKSFVLCPLFNLAGIFRSQNTAALY